MVSTAPAQHKTPERGRLRYVDETKRIQSWPLSLHDALPISESASRPSASSCPGPSRTRPRRASTSNSSSPQRGRSEEHTSELQSRLHLVCRLLLEKKNIVSVANDPMADRIQGYRPAADDGQ